MSSKQVYILDTTLRDGQQSPGAGMSFEDNLQYAEIANKLHIDILEAGFPSASNADFAIVNRISQNMADVNSTMKISALCQLREDQVVRTMESLQPSLAIGRARIHIYVPVDPELMTASLGKLANDKPLITATVHRLIKMMADQGFEVEFSPEGYSRQQDNFDFTTDLIRHAIDAGATVINCPDTIGGASHFQGEAYFINNMAKHKAIMEQEFPNKEITWSMHCHNDFGTALENSLNGVFRGVARQIEGCINGVGERAGNVALEQCIMMIRQFGQATHLAQAYHTDIDIQYLKQASDFIAERMLPRQPHSPIVGKNSASHTSGGHINAILKNPLAYQPFDPRDVGSEISFVFGPLSGSNHAQQILAKFGYQCTDSEKVAVTQAIKDCYADRRKGITDDELLLAYKKYRAAIKLEDLSYAKDNSGKTIVTFHGQFFSQQDLVVEYQGRSSALSALNKAVNAQMPTITVIDYNSRSKGVTVDATCASTIFIDYNGKHFNAEAEDDDIEISALKAFIAAVNMAYVEEHFKLN